MPHIPTSFHVTSYLGLAAFLVLWLVFFRCAHLFLTIFRHGPLVGWAIGPLGVTVLFLHEPPALYIWLDVLCPAIVSGTVLYVGLFTSLSPVTLPHSPFIEILIISCGVLITSTGDLINALQDVRHPLWGEARILRNMQNLRTTWAKIHFTPFGYTYLRDHFGSSPTDLMQAL